jgi:NIMA (never in mitosis gene a)-related kinase
VYKTKNGKLCIVTEYAEGGDLEQRINKTKASNLFFSEAQIIDWLN